MFLLLRISSILLTVILFLFAWHEILENPHRLFANVTACGNCVSADLESDHCPERAESGLGLGRDQPAIDPKFASDGSQSTLNLRDV